MDPETPEHDNKDAGCICQRWPMLVMSLAFFLLGAVGLITAYALLQDKALEHKFHYGVIIDAGSSHTDLAVFAWPSDHKYEGTAKVEQLASSTCSRKGISSFKEDPKIAGDVISSCIESIALKAVPKHDRKRTPIHLGATAGMRLLCGRDRKACKEIMLHVNKAFDKYEFKHHNKSARVLSGKEEGAFGWITVNVLKKTFDDGEDGERNESVVGALDMGGGSTEISFIPDSKTRIPDEYRDELVIYGNNYSLYTHSFLCYGMKEAERRVLASLVQRSNFSSTITNPCYPSGFTRTESAKDIWLLPCSMKPKSTIFPIKNEKEYVITGSSNYDECRMTIRSLFNETECRFGPCSFNGAYQPSVRGKFLAFSGYGYVAKFFNLTEDDSIEELSKAGKIFCKENWHKIKKQHSSTPDKFLHKYCFNAEYMHQILTFGFHFKNTSKQVSFVENINGISVGWSLGYMVNSSNLIPVEKPKSRLTRESFLFFCCVSVVIIAFSLVLCFCYSVKKLRKKDDYTPIDSE